MVSKKISKNNRYMLKGAFRKCGFDRWRLVISGFSRSTGEERTFFVEFYILNPLVSPDEMILGFKSRLAKTEADLQYALAGTQSAKTASQELMMVPSYVMVKAGCYGLEGKQINSFFASSKLEIGHKEFIIRCGPDRLAQGGGEGACMLSDKGTRGTVNVTYAELNEKPELLCNAGTMDWDLHYDPSYSFEQDFTGKEINWHILGAATCVSGIIHLDGEEYQVVPKSSFGYFDKNWGKDFPSPFFHLSSSNLTSTITGKPLLKSCFAVQGIYNGVLTVCAKMDEYEVEFNALKKKNYEITFDCSQMPKDDDGIKVHWTVSVHNRNSVLDIDIFCPTDLMFVRDYESPLGGRKLMKILGGGTGTGEIRLYRKIKKNLELIEHATVSNALCEFGNFELPEL